MEKPSGPIMTPRYQILSTLKEHFSTLTKGHVSGDNRILFKLPGDVEGSE
jgi:hypothetical protein